MKQSIAAIAAARVSPGTSRAIARYSSAYRVTHLANRLGFAVAIIGLVFASTGVLGCLMSCAGMAFGDGAGALGGAMIFPLGMASLFFGGLLTCLGILMRAQAQTSLAALDAAVYACPFLTDDERAQAIRL